MISEFSLGVCTVHCLCSSCIMFVWKLYDGYATIAHQICNCCATIAHQLCNGCAVDMGLRGMGAHPLNFGSQAARNTFSRSGQIQLTKSKKYCMRSSEHIDMRWLGAQERIHTARSRSLRSSGFARDFVVKPRHHRRCRFRCETTAPLSL